MNLQSLIDLIKDSHNNSVDRGWWDENRSFGEVISLIHSELSEALEFYRDQEKLLQHGVDYLIHYTGKGEISNKLSDITPKPDGVLAEFTEVLIRIFDYVGKIDKSEKFVQILQEKHEYNKTRPYKHGDKKI